MSDAVMDPPETDFRPVRLRRTFSDGGVQTVGMLTHCARRKASVESDECARCVHHQGTCFDPVERGWYRLCWREDEPHAQPPRTPLGPDTPLRALLRDEVVCVAPDTDLSSLVALFVERRLDAAPVVDPDGHPLGVLSKTDLLRECYEANPTGAPEDGPAPRALHDLGAGFRIDKPRTSTAREAMTPLVFALPEDAPAARAAALIAFEGVHHVVVTGTGGRVVGFVSALDLVGCLASAPPSVAPGPGSPGP